MIEREMYNIFSIQSVIIVSYMTRDFHSYGYPEVANLRDSSSSAAVVAAEVTTRIYFLFDDFFS